VNSGHFTHKLNKSAKFVSKMYTLAIWRGTKVPVMFIDSQTDRKITYILGKKAYVCLLNKLIYRSILYICYSQSVKSAIS
jgi:hypothetical protein